MECAKVTAGLRKPKKKHVKDEVDRIKQAEKKKRRLEKALATSLAIRSELEKKKLKKKEQERLDEEGAAIAEAVALQVLIGEDSDEILLKKNDELTMWDRATDISIIVGGHYDDLSKYSSESIERVDQYGRFWSQWGNSNSMGLSGYVGGQFCPRYFGEECWSSVGLSDDRIAAQAVSSLNIGDDARVDAYIFNHVS